jgi:hypothetical protein
LGIWDSLLVIRREHGHAGAENAGVSGFFNVHTWIPSYFPEVAVRVLEVARITAPKTLMSRIGDRSAGSLRLLHDGVDLRPAIYILSKRKLRCTRLSEGNIGIASKIASWKKSKPEAAPKIEEGHGTVFELLPDDALRRKAQAIAIEIQRSLQIVHAKG